MSTEEFLQRIRELEDENAALRQRLDMLEKGRNPLTPLIISRPVDRCDGKMDSNMNDENKSNLPNISNNMYINDNPHKILQCLKTILGFSIKYEKNKIFLRSVYSFCEEDIFEVEIDNNKIILNATEYLNEWKEYVHTYIKVGKSYSAFFAAVTLDLFNKKTFG